MSYRDAPVGYTCPDIDAVIGIINDTINVLRRYNVSEDESQNETISNCIEELNGLTNGRNAKMEVLRAANDSLRTWGYEMRSEWDESDSKVSDLEDRIEELADELSEAKDTTSELERQVESLEDKLESAKSKIVELEQLEMEFA